MTQLDRLEALVEEAIPLLPPIQKHDTLGAAYYAAIEQIEAMLPEIIPALPDLIRVARAMGEVLDHLHAGAPDLAQATAQEAIRSPLYREVES